MSDPAEPVARHDHPSTWHRCLAPGCAERVDPWDRNHRCAQHRAEWLATAGRRHPTISGRIITDEASL